MNRVCGINSLCVVLCSENYFYSFVSQINFMSCTSLFLVYFLCGLKIVVISRKVKF